VEALEKVDPANAELVHLKKALSLKANSGS
jgi:hypothetical protein